MLCVCLCVYLYLHVCERMCVSVFVCVSVCASVSVCACERGCECECQYCQISPGQISECVVRNQLKSSGRANRELGEYI
uniref:Secreted protein n=1 Tax=Anguilla anguilla TaxID=7936 RepID=A0A0E9SLF1_ANGAN